MKNIYAKFEFVYFLGYVRVFLPFTHIIFYIDFPQTEMSGVYKSNFNRRTRKTLPISRKNRKKSIKRVIYFRKINHFVFRLFSFGNRIWGKNCDLTIVHKTPPRREVIK